MFRKLLHNFNDFRTYFCLLETSVYFAEPSLKIVPKMYYGSHANISVHAR